MQKMPVLFIGHGSPMNAIEDNTYTRTWRDIATKIPEPEAILAISAHWFTDGTRIQDNLQPKMIYDFYGFPKEIYAVNYLSPGAPDLAAAAKTLIGEGASLDNSWGYDHGTWSVLNVMYPKTHIPVFQLSVNQNASADYHFEIGKKINSLREKGVLILGSGNVVHNLSKINWDMEDGYDWAVQFDDYIKDKISAGQYQDVVDYQKAGEYSKLVFDTSEHFDPLLYVLGAADESDRLSIYNNTCTLGALSMTCYLFA
jgi:4,5-DOPA dioxygenase extradiol